MDDPQNLESQSLRDRAWTTDEIRKHSSNWTLAGDVGLFNLLNEFSHHIISRTHEVENAVDSLVHQAKMASAKINNTINDFHMLSNLQFVENRVYDEEVQEPVNENKPVPEKTKEQKEAEMMPKIVKAIELGLAVLDTAFDRINVNEISDSEDEEDISSEGRTILEPKDPYENRPLPYIIGSDMFMKCDFAGLKDLVEEEVQSFSEESNISESDSTSSDEEPLPLDDDQFSDKLNDQVSRNISDKISSSDESELFGSEKEEKETNGFASDSSLEFKTKEKNIQKPPVDAQPRKDTRQNSVSSLQTRLKLPQVLPVPKLQENKKDDDLFGNEENSEDESPFRKKTGLFTSDVRFDDEKDGDLFGGDLFGNSPSKEVKDVKPTEVPKVSSKQPQIASVPEKKKPVLFDNDEEDSEDEFFNTLLKTKKPTSKASNAGNQDSSEKADSSSTPSSAPSTTPGNAFDFVTGGGGDSLFGDDSDVDDLFSSKKATQGKKFDFGTSENDDLFGINSKPSKSSKVASETKALFEDNKVSDQPVKKIEPQKSLPVKKKTKDSIFEDSDSSDQGSPQQIKPSIPTPVKSKTDINLFGDDDFEDDIFTKTSKKSDTTKAKKNENTHLFEKSKQISSQEPKPAKTVEKAKPLSLFDDTDKSESEASKPVKAVEKPRTLSLFDDTEEESSESSSIVPRKEQNKTLSLFEDSDNLDLFAPKPAIKKTEIPSPVQIIKPATAFPKAKNEIHGALSSKVPEPAAEFSKPKDEIDGAFSSKVSSPSKEGNIDIQASFDTPIDSSNVLNVINKGRVKMAAKRRKPTRQGRLAALENSEKETKTGVESDVVTSDPVILDDSSDSLFSIPVTKNSVEVVSTKVDYKTQEKTKKNLMSQLISEVATSKIGLKKAVEKKEEEDEVDIFTEVAQKDRAKSSFSFLPPEENGIAAMFPVEKKEEKTVDLNESKSDSFDDDFFTEPSFHNFRSSISHKNSVLDLEDDDDDDDLFRTIKTNILPKPGPSESNVLFDDDTDIFADVQKEKYEMFPSQVYEDDEDDIFGNMTNPVSNKVSSTKPSISSSVKKVEKQQVNAFDDPLTGLLGDD